MREPMRDKMSNQMELSDPMKPVYHAAIIRVRNGPAQCMDELADIKAVCMLQGNVSPGT